MKGEIKSNVKRGKIKMSEKMVCCVCGLEDNSYTAYCSKCGRVPHKIIKQKQEKNEYYK